MAEGAAPKPAPAPAPEELHRGIHHMREDIRDLRNQIGSIHQRIDGVREDIRDLRNQIGGVHQRIDETNRRIDETNRSQNAHFMWTMTTLVAITGILIAVIKL